MVLSDLANVKRAWQALNDPKIVGGLNTEQYLELCLAAGYSQEVSEKAACDWANKRLESGLPI